MQGRAPMTETKLYVALALVFLLISGLVWVALNFWSRHFSSEARALSGRLQDIVNVRRGQQPKALSKTRLALQAPWLRWVLRYAPGVQTLTWLIRRSGSQLSLVQVMALCAGLGLATASLIFWGLGGPWWISGLSGCVAWALPWLWLLHREKKRRLRFEDQLPEALDFMTRALRAGYGLSIAMGMVSDELPDPVGGEFKTTFDQINLGVSFGDAMAEMADRINSSDLNFLVIALRIQRKTGGNLTELLTSLSKTVRERIKLKGKVRVLASEGKLSGLLIGALPFVLGGILSAVNPVYMATLWNTGAGRTLVLVCLVMMALGAAWMWKIVEIKV